MTSLSHPALRARFLRILWLSLALHAAVIGLARLPQTSLPGPAQEMQVSLSSPVPPGAPATVSATAARDPEPRKPLAPVGPVPAAPQPVDTPVPMAPAPLPAPQAAGPQASAPTAAVASVSPAQEAPGPQVNIPQLLDTRYYTVKEVDALPAALRKPDPVYPPQAEEQGVTGGVLIRLHLEADGRISQAEVISVSPGGVFGEMFRKSALESLQDLRFRPARRNGVPVRALVEFRVVFEQDRP